MPMQARSRYYPRLADAKLSLRPRLATSQHKTTHCSCLVLGDMPLAYHPPRTEARLSALHWHRLLRPSHYLLTVAILRQLPTYLSAIPYILP